jgi:histidinol-phosphate/aromatic aminotransferase/cobyric acid decarboxylase-like protein
VAAVHALQERDYYLKCWQETHILRSNLISGLRKCCPRAEITDGCTNSVLWHLPTDGLNGAELIRRCRNRNLFLRDVGGLAPDMGEHTVRIAVKDEVTQERMIDILSWVLSG